MKQLTLAISAILLLTACSTTTTTTTNSNVSITPTDSTPITSVQPVGNSFVAELLAKLPNNYIIEDGIYYEDLQSENGVSAKIVYPCKNETYQDPINAPLCYTNLILFEDGTTSSLDEYIQNNELLKWYKSALLKDIIKSSYQGKFDMAHTSDAFMCPGTGAETCSRERYIYHLPSGLNIVAELHYWSYVNGENAPTPKNVLDVVDIYKKALTK